MGERENVEWGTGNEGTGELGNGQWGNGEWGNGGAREEMGDGGGLPDSINHNFVVCTTSTFRYST